MSLTDRRSVFSVGRGRWVLNRWGFELIQGVRVSDDLRVRRDRAKTRQDARQKERSIWHEPWSLTQRHSWLKPKLSESAAPERFHSSDIDLVDRSGALLDELKAQFGSAPHQALDEIIGPGAVFCGRHDLQ